jgi:hypothetical protein
MARRGFGKIDPAAIVRERPAGVPGGGSALEAALLFAVRAAGLSEPEREWPFAWCCPHSKGAHMAGKQPLGVCRGCAFGVRSMRTTAAHKFLHERNWRFDFAWPDRRVAVEVEGGMWSEGRHVRGTGFLEDCRKYAEAALRGWLVLRVTGEHIESGEALEWIERALARTGEA